MNDQTGRDWDAGAQALDPLLAQWARFRDRVGEAISARPDFWTLDELETRIAAHQVFFFPGRDAALLGYIDVYPGGAKAFRVAFQIGDAAECETLMPGVEALARMMGCTCMLFEGAPGGPGDGLKGYEPFMLMLHKAL